MRYRFGDFELEPASYELRRGGEATRIEPRVFELLVYLIEERDRVVPKSELLDRVWKDQFVGDSVLSRAVYEARRCLGETSQEPRYLQTVHGRGYRFIGEVDVGEPPAESRARASEPEEETAGGEGDAPAPPVPTKAGPLGRRWLWGVVVVSLLLGALALGWLSRRGGSAEPVREASAQQEPESDSSGRRLAVLPFRSEDDSVAILALSMQDLVEARLRHVPGLSVRLSEATSERLAAATSLESLATELSLDALLSGTVKPSVAGDKAIVEVTLYELGDGGRLLPTPIGEYELPYLERSEDLQAFVAVREAIVANALGRIAPALQLPVESTQVPKTPSAYRLFLLARDRMQQNFCEGGGAIELLKRSLEEDDSYYASWDLLASAYYNQVWACAADGQYFDRALEAADRAIALAPGLIDSHLLRSTILVETGRVEEGYEALEALEPFEDALGMYAPAYALRYAGFLDRAAEIVAQVLARDALYFSDGVGGEVPATYLYQGRLTEFLRQLPASGSAYHRYFRGFAETLLGHPDTAAAVLEPAFRENPGDVFGRLASALLAQIEGDSTAAIEIVRQVARQREAQGAVDGEITFKQAEILALAGDASEALEQLKRAVDQGFFCPRCLREDPVLAPLRSLTGMGDILAAADARHRAFAERFGLAPDLGDL